MATSGSKYFIIFVINLALNILGTDQLLLPSLIDGDDSNTLIKKFFESNEDIPSLIEEIAKLEKDDGLNKYNLGLENEDKDLNITQLISKYGYQVHVHTVTTSDGYVLTMHRIPSDGPPVFLMHGVLSSSNDFFTVGPDKALPYLLSNAGYDVWLGNARGNDHSRKHVTLSPEKDKARFFDYSYHEIGYYDLPAMIDYILHFTGEETLNYVGFSQGTTTFFVMCSERPEYNKKIKVMVALSAVAYMSHIISPLFRLFSAVEPIASIVTPLLGFNEVPTRSPLVQLVSKRVCGDTVLANLVCANIMFVLMGFDYEQLNVTNTPVLFGHFPSGASMKQMYHFGQGVNSGKFRQYDHGVLQNLQKYGTAQPPEYKLENVNAPVAIFHAKNDWLAVYEDVTKLAKRLQQLIEFYEVPFEKFNHGDYLWAKDADKLVYDEVLKLLTKYNT